MSHGVQLNNIFYICIVICIYILSVLPIVVCSMLNCLFFLIQGQALEERASGVENLKMNSIQTSDMIDHTL